MLGRRLAKARKDARLTQVELGSRLGVPQKTISNWESGNNTPSLEYFKKLAVILEVSADSLLGLS